jgi:hypothetical protein
MCCQPWPEEVVVVVVEAILVVASVADLLQAHVVKIYFIPMARTDKPNMAMVVEQVAAGVATVATEISAAAAMEDRSIQEILGVMLVSMAVA